MKKFRLLSSFLATLMVLSMLMVIPVSAAERPFEGPYDFEELVATGENVTDPAGGTKCYPVSKDSYVGNILKCIDSNSYNDFLFVDLQTFDGTNSAHSNASGNIITTRRNKDFYLLNNIETDFGVETYEFDFLWNYTAKQALYLKCQETGAYLLNGDTEGIFSNASDNTVWKHMVIKYDTEADTLSVEIDGDVLNTLEGVEAFDQPLILSGTTAAGGGVGSRARVFRMDNYKSYVTYEPNTSLSALDITMEDNSEITLPGNTGAEGLAIKVTANAVNTNTEPMNVTVIYALYKDDELVDAASQAVTIPKEIFTAQPVSATFTTEANVEFDTVKAFVWDDLGAALSKTVAVSYQAN